MRARVRERTPQICGLQYRLPRARAGARLPVVHPQFEVGPVSPAPCARGCEVLRPSTLCGGGCAITLRARVRAQTQIENVQETGCPHACAGARSLARPSLTVVQVPPCARGCECSSPIGGWTSFACPMSVGTEAVHHWWLAYYLGIYKANPHWGMTSAPAPCERGCEIGQPPVTDDLGTARYARAGHPGRGIRGQPRCVRGCNGGYVFLIYKKT